RQRAGALALEPRFRVAFDEAEQRAAGAQRVTETLPLALVLRLVHGARELVQFGQRQRRVEIVGERFQHTRGRLARARRRQAAQLAVQAIQLPLALGDLLAGDVERRAVVAGEQRE